MADVQADALMTLTMEAEDDSSDIVGVVTDSLDVMREAIGAVGIATAIAFVKGAEDLQGYGLQIQKVAFMTGETTQESSRLISAFEGSGMSADAAAGMVQRLEMRLGTMIAQQKAAAAAHRVSKTALDELGISTMDAAGHTLNMTQILPQIIDKLHNMTDASERARIGQQLFGRNWSSMAPLIEAGGAAFTKAGLDADKFGLVLSQNDVNAAHAAEVAHQHLTESVQGISNALGTIAMPIITIWTEKIANWIALLQTLSPAQLTMITQIIGLVAVVATLFGGMSATTEAVKLLTSGLGESGQKAVMGFMHSLTDLLGPLTLVLAVGFLVYEAYQHVAWVHQLLEPLVRTLTAAFQEASSVWNHTHDVASTFKDVMDQMGTPVWATQAAIGAVSTVMQNWAPILGTAATLIGLITTAVILQSTWMAIKRGYMATDIALSGIQAVMNGQLTLTEYAMASGGFMAAAAELAMLWPFLLIAIAIAAVLVVGYLLIFHWKEVHAWLIMLEGRLSSFANYLGGGFMSAWRAVTAGIGGVFNTVIATVEGAWANIMARFNGFTDYIGTFITGIVATFAAGWKDFTSHPLYWIGFIVAYIPTKLIELEITFIAWMAGLVSRFLGWAGTMITNATNWVGNFINSVRLEINAFPVQWQAWLDGIFRRFSAWAVNLVLSGQRMAMDFTLAVMREWNALPGQISAWANGVMTTVGQFLTNLITTGTNQAHNFVTTLVTELQKAPGQMVQIGIDIIQGVINGIMSMITAGQNAIGSFVHGLLDGAHKAGQGGSPYMLFANEVGTVGIAQGIALGIGNGAGAAQTAMTSLLGSLSGSSVTSLAARMPAAAIGGGMASAAAANAIAATPAMTSAGGGVGPQADIVLKLDAKELARVVFDVGAQRWKLLGGTLGSGA